MGLWEGIVLEDHTLGNRNTTPLLGQPQQQPAGSGGTPCPERSSAAAARQGLFLPLQPGSLSSAITRASLPLTTTPTHTVGCAF